MPYTQDDYRKQVRNLVKDKASKLEDAGDYDSALDSACRWYSDRKPRKIAIDLTSDGTNDWLATSLIGFDEDFSYIIKAEYPISSSGDDENELETDSYRLIRKPAGLTFRLFKGISSGQIVRVTYTSLHSITSSAVTLPDSAFIPVCEYAAADLCDMLSRLFTQRVSEMPQTDGSMFRSVADEYGTRAKILKMKAEAKIPVPVGIA